MAGTPGSDPYPPGTRVRVTLKGVMATSQHPGCTSVRCGPGSTLVADIPNRWPGLQVDPIAPPEWPAEPGDIWEDLMGQVWFFYLSEHDSTLSARNATGGYIDADPISYFEQPSHAMRKLRHRLGAGEG